MKARKLFVVARMHVLCLRPWEGKEVFGKTFPPLVGGWALSSLSPDVCLIVLMLWYRLYYYCIVSIPLLALLVMSPDASRLATTRVTT